MTLAYTENAYEIFEEPVAAVFLSEDTNTWWRIQGPNGILPQAYLNKSDAEEVCERKNKDPHFDPRVFCEEIKQKMPH